MPQAGRLKSPGSIKVPELRADLNPSMHKWTIKVRVVSRTNVRVWSNGQGLICDARLADAEGGTIRVVAFDELADKLYVRAVPGSIVTISNGTLQPTVTFLTTRNHRSVSK